MSPQVQNILVYIIGAATLLIILLRLYRNRRRGNPCAGCQLKEHCNGKQPVRKPTGNSVPEKGSKKISGNNCRTRCRPN